MGKQIRIDFYKVVTECNFAAAVRKIWALPDEEGRNFQFSDGPVRLRMLEEVDGILIGDMVRIRLGEPAFLAKLTGGERPITQDNDEGLGETNAFAYSSKSGFFAYQRNRHGVSASKAAFYFEQKPQVNHAVVFEPVLAPVAINQLMGKGPPKRLRLKVATSTIQPGSARSEALEEVIDAAQLMKCAEMEVTFSMGRKRRGAMSKEKVIGFVKKVLQLRSAGHNVKALEVAAADEAGGKAEILDFIDATLYSIQTVEPSPLIDEFYHRRAACIRAAWDAHQADLS